MPRGNEQFEVWAELDGSNALTRRRASGLGFDEHIARQSAAGAVEWYAADHLGSVRLILDNSGSVTGTVDYDAFGQVLSGTVSDYGYAGYRRDSITSLDSVRAREYDPGTGMWYSEDPLGLRPDTNPFRYVGNSVTNATDPSGMEDWRDRLRNRVAEGFSRGSEAAGRLFNRLDRGATRAQDLAGDALGFDSTRGRQLNAQRRAMGIPTNRDSPRQSAPGAFAEGLGVGAGNVATGAGQMLIEVGQIARDYGNTLISGYSQALNQAFGTGVYTYDLHSGLFGGYDQAVREGRGVEYQLEQAGNLGSLGLYPLIDSLVDAVRTGDST